MMKRREDEAGVAPGRERERKRRQIDYRLDASAELKPPSVRARNITIIERYVGQIVGIDCETNTSCQPQANRKNLKCAPA